MAIIRFAFVVDDEVSHITEIDEEFNPTVTSRIINMFRNNPNPTFVEIEDGAIGRGWTWDGQDFFSPEE